MRWFQRGTCKPRRDPETLKAIERAETANREADEDLEKMKEYVEKMAAERKRNHFGEALERAFKGGRTN